MTSLTEAKDPISMNLSLNKESRYFFNKVGKIILCRFLYLCLAIYAEIVRKASNCCL